MKLGDICSAPCFRSASDFIIPRPGCSQEQLEFAHESGRRFYAVLLSNHPSASSVNPRVAIVGLSPAGNQIEQFVTAYNETGSYSDASVAAAFAGLAPDIIGMFKGLGLAQRMGLNFNRADTLAGHPDIFATSLVACASLTSNLSSDDFDPSAHTAARECASRRFLGQVLNPKFSRLTHIFILGAKGWAAVEGIRTDSGATVLEALRKAGKTVLNLPHPSGQNQEYVRLASLHAAQFPSCERYVMEKWLEYQLKPPRRGRSKEPEAKYKAKRITVWNTINTLRREISRIGGVG